MRAARAATGDQTLRVYDIPRNAAEAAKKGIQFNQQAADLRIRMANASRRLRKAKGQAPRKFKGGKQVNENVSKSNLTSTEKSRILELAGLDSE